MWEKGFYKGKPENIIMIHNNAMLKKNKLFEEIGIRDDTRIIVQIDDEEFLPKPKNQAPDVKSPTLAEVMPKPPKEGYITKPSWNEIKKMSIEQLKRVKNFTIENQFGIIEFLGEVDLTNVDLADVVSITHMEVEVYDEKRHQNNYPERGTKLNIPAKVTLKKVNLRKNDTAVSREMNLKKGLEPSGAKHLSYNAGLGLWTFAVDHFTKYGTNHNDDEDD